MAQFSATSAEMMFSRVHMEIDEDCKERLSFRIHPQQTDVRACLTVPVPITSTHTIAGEYIVLLE